MHISRLLCSAQANSTYEIETTLPQSTQLIVCKIYTYFYSIQCYFQTLSLTHAIYLFIALTFGRCVMCVIY